MLRGLGEREGVCIYLLHVCVVGLCSNSKWDEASNVHCEKSDYKKVGGGRQREAEELRSSSNRSSGRQEAALIRKEK